MPREGVHIWHQLRLPGAHRRPAHALAAEGSTEAGGQRVSSMPGKHDACHLTACLAEWRTIAVPPLTCRVCAGSPAPPGRAL